MTHPDTSRPDTSHTSHPETSRPEAARPSDAEDRDILELARERSLERGEGLTEEQILRVLSLPDERVSELLELAHQVRLKWCGDMVEVEGIVSLKTGGCPEDCHFCSQSGVFQESPVRAARIDIPELLEAARATRKTGATEFCIVAAVKGPDERLFREVEAAIDALAAEVNINISVSVGILNRDQAERLAARGVHRYNHNLETARSFFPQIVTTHTWEDRMETIRLIREVGIEVCCGGIVGLGESLAQRAEFFAQLAAIDPEEVPINFLDPRPGTPLEDQEVIDTPDALRAIGALRLAMPKTVIRYAGGRELALGEKGTEAGLLGGINALIAGNYLTTLGDPAERDLDMLGRLQLPLKVLNRVV